MKLLLSATTFCGLTVLLSACALGPASLQEGSTEAEIVARYGRPTAYHQDGNARLLEYRQGPAGQTTYMARIGADNRLLSYEQVLTLEKFSTIKPDLADKEDVLRTVGTSSEVRYFPFIRLDAWSYPYKEAGVWDSMMTVYLDRTGIVRRLENGPDMHRMNRDNDR